jgi:hypothetical protein
LADLACSGLLRRASADDFSELETGLARVGPLGSVPGMSKLVNVILGEMTTREDAVSRPMRWEAIGLGEALFPVLDADIVLTRAGDDVILAVWGTYRPPLGGVGETLAQALMQRVGQATIGAFTQRIAAAITEAAFRTGPQPGLLPDELPELDADEM